VLICWAADTLSTSSPPRSRHRVAGFPFLSLPQCPVINKIIPSLQIKIRFINKLSRHFFYICSMNRLRHFFEWRLFGVCTLLGERFNISISRIRMWFIYISFLTFGSPIIVYCILAFWMNVKQYILSAKRNPLRWF